MQYIRTVDGSEFYTETVACLSVAIVSCHESKM